MSKNKVSSSEDLSNPQTPMEYLRLFLTGFAMGASDIVPGVSGGTMAFILGVYETLINAIKSFNIDAIRLALGFKIRELLEHISFKFLIALGLGLGVAILTLSGFLSSTMEDPQGRIFLFAFFFGLVLASIVSIGVKVKWVPLTIGMFIVGTIVAFVIVNVVPTEGEHSTPILFVSGMIAITAMILPGISGSFMLLIMGQYDYVLSAVSDLDIGTIATVGAGAVVGIIAFSRILSFLLARYYDATVALLVGFMAGSLWKIYPWKTCLESDLDRHGDFRCLAEQNILPEFASSEFIIAIGLLIIGFLLVNFLDHLQSNENPIFRRIWTRG